MYAKDMNRAAGHRHGGEFGAFDLATIGRWSQRFAPLIAERDRLMRSYARGKRAMASFWPLPAKAPAGSASPEAYVASLSVELIFRRRGEDGGAGGNRTSHPQDQTRKKEEHEG